MTTLTRTGYLIPNTPKLTDIKKELTVRPQVNGDYGFPPPPFKVFKPAKPDMGYYPFHVVMGKRLYHWLSPAPSDIER